MKGKVQKLISDKILKKNFVISIVFTHIFTFLEENK